MIKFNVASPINCKITGIEAKIIGTGTTVDVVNDFFFCRADDFSQITTYKNIRVNGIATYNTGFNIARQNVVTFFGGGTFPPQPGTMQVVIRKVTAVDSNGNQVVVEGLPLFGNIINCGNPQMIKVLSPNGGEKLTVGQTLDVTWSSSGLSGKYIHIRLNLDNPNFEAGLDIKQDVLIDLGRYSWTIPATLEGFNLGDKTNKYTIEIITHKDAGQYDFSDNYFSIVAPPRVSNINLTIPPYSNMRIETSNFADGSSLEMTAVKFMLWGQEWRIPVVKGEKYDLTLYNNFNSKTQSFTLELKGIGAIDIYINGKFNNACLIIDKGAIWLPKLPPIPEQFPK
jgi:hypothetical protein